MIKNIKFGALLLLLLVVGLLVLTACQAPPADKASDRKGDERIEQPEAGEGNHTTSGIPVIREGTGGRS